MRSTHLAQLEPKLNQLSLVRVKFGVFRKVKPEQASKVTMRMPTLLPFGEGCTSGEAIDTRTRSIRRGSGHGTSEG